jgi:hypothetical protein
VTALAATHGSNTDVFVNGNVVSQYFNDMTLTQTRDKAETSAFKSLFKSYVAGLIDAVATLTGMFDSSSAIAEDNLLYGYLTALVALDNSWFYAPNGAQGSTAQNQVAYAVFGLSTKYEIKSAMNSANTISAEVQLDNIGGGVERGVILSPWATQGAGGNSASFDSGTVSTANGGVLVVHAFSDTASLVVNLQDSADNSTFANVTGYNISPTNATAAAYRYPAAGTAPTGTIRRYTRVTWTGTGTFLALFARH